MTHRDLPLQNKLNGLKLLLVEDDFLIQLDLQTLLEGAGARVVTAATLREAEELIAEPYDIAILDIRLPDGEVKPVADELAARQTPIIFHSGNTETVRWLDGFPNAVAFSKPVDETVLIDAVRHYSSKAA